MRLRDDGRRVGKVQVKRSGDKMRRGGGGGNKDCSRPDGAMVGCLSVQLVGVDVEGAIQTSRRGGSGSGSGSGPGPGDVGACRIGQDDAQNGTRNPG